MNAAVIPLNRPANVAKGSSDEAGIDCGHLRVIVKDAIRATIGVSDLTGRSGRSLSLSIARRLSSWFDQTSAGQAIQEELGVNDLHGERTTLLTELAARLDYGRREVCPPGHATVR